MALRDLQSRIHRVGAQQLEWPFRGTPVFKTKGPNTYARSHSVDPFPCYPHDRGLVADTAARVEELFPVDDQVDYFLTEFEELGRTNGYSDKTDVYDKASGKYVRWEPTVILVGKRIPPHPGMTRYLVAHEYGHVVQWWVEKIRKIDSNKETTDLDLEYMRLRPGSHNEYGGGKWHENVGELLANDFRVLVCGIEEDFWPHPGFPHPRVVEGVQQFWKKVMEEVDAVRKTEESAK